MESSCASRPFDFEPYNFKRKPSYFPHSYLPVIINQNFIGQGAMGLIYRATAEIERASGSKYRRNVIVDKLAIGIKKNKLLTNTRYTRGWLRVASLVVLLAVTVCFMTWKLEP